MTLYLNVNRFRTREEERAEAVEMKRPSTADHRLRGDHRHLANLGGDFFLNYYSRCLALLYSNP